MNDVSDRIEKQIHLAAPARRVWRAIADSQQFGRWFGIQIEGPWVVGKPMRGVFSAPISQAMIDGALASAGLPSAKIAAKLPEVFCVVDSIEPETHFRFRWIPFGIDEGIDPETEPMTLVDFHVAPDGGGTKLSVTESGFDAIPIARRRRAFLMNTGGWMTQLKNIDKYLREASAS